MSKADKQKSIPAASLRTLGNRAATFTMPVTVNTVDGSPIKLTLTCKALRKTEWAKLRDDRQRAAMEAVLSPAPEAEGGATESAERSPVADALAAIAKRGHEANVRDGLARDAETILSFATGWDLEDDFTQENLQALEDEFGGALMAVLHAYDTAIYQGRVGN